MSKEKITRNRLTTEATNLTSRVNRVSLTNQARTVTSQVTKINLVKTATRVTLNITHINNPSPIGDGLFSYVLWFDCLN